MSYPPIHKYKNKGYDKAPERPSMLYIFEKSIVQGYQKSYFHEANMQIQKYKYTNTAYDKVPERPKMLYIFEERIVPRCQK